MDPVKNELIALRALIEESPTPTALYTGREMKIHIANKAMIYNTWGKDRSVLGKTLKEALPELEGQPFHQLLDDVYTTGKAYEATEDLVRIMIDGVLQEHYYNFTYKPLFNSAGEVWGILNTATNVTALVRARKQVADTEMQMTFSLNAAGIGTWDLDLTDQLVVWDSRTKELFGFSRDEIVTYEDALRYIHTQDRLLVDNAVARALDPASGGNYDVKFRTIGVDDGKLRWLHCKGKAYFDNEGNANRLSGIAQDISEQVVANEKIYSAEQLTQLALENIDAGSYFVNIATNDITYTPTFARVITGNEDLSMERDDFIKHIHPDDVTIRRKAYEAAMNTGRLYYEARFIWTNGTMHWVRVIGRYMHNDKDTPTHFAGIVQDISAEAEARQEQHKLLWLIDNSTDVISLADRDGKLTYLNHAGLQMLGFDSLEEAKRHQTELVMPSEAERVIHVINPTLLQDERWAGEMVYRHFKTGEPVPAYATSLLLRDTITAHPIGLASVIRDMRPELAAKQALINSEELFRAITTASPAAMWMTDTQGNITYVNQIWINWTGKGLEAHLGTGWLDVVLKEDVKAAAAKFAHDFENRRFHESQFRIQHTDGNIRWVVCTGNPQYSADGNFKGFIGACVDITEQKHLQQQKDEFIGIASHELKTPVTSIKAYAQVLQAMFQREDDGKKVLMLNKMNSQVDRLTSLIGDLLDVTKVRSGRLQFNDDHFDLNQLVTEICEDLQRTTSKHTIVTDLKPVALVYADRDRITQVISNLITNAIKYSPGANKIIVSNSIKNNNEVQLCIKDFGIGISADKQEKVFEQFYRVSGDNQYTFPGLGLGLFISSEIIKREGGRIWVNSVPGQGSTFCFSLPLYR